jgi:5-methylcytosine-specific restriction endonuclease McrA
MNTYKTPAAQRERQARWKREQRKKNAEAVRAKARGYYQDTLIARRVEGRRGRRTAKVRGMVALGGVCVVCGTDELLELDHIIPCVYLARKSQRSEWLRAARGDTSNLQLLCHTHHTLKTFA